MISEPLDTGDIKYWVFDNGKNNEADSILFVRSTQ